MPMTDLAAAWRSDAGPGQLAAMDQRVAARVTSLREQGATVASGKTAGAGGLLSLQSAYRCVINDPRTDADSPTFAALTDSIYAESTLAAHMLGARGPAPASRVYYETRTVPDRRGAAGGILAGVAAGILAMLGLAYHIDASRVGRLPDQVAPVVADIATAQEDPPPGVVGDQGVADVQVSEPSIPDVTSPPARPPVTPPEPVPARPTSGTCPECVTPESEEPEWVVPANGPGGEDEQGLLAELVSVVGGLL